MVYSMGAPQVIVLSFLCFYCTHSRNYLITLPLLAACHQRMNRNTEESFLTLGNGVRRTTFSLTSVKQKYLGVHLNKKLDWSHSTGALYKKDRSRLRLLRRLRFFGVSKALVRTFDYTLVASAVS